MMKSIYVNHEPRPSKYTKNINESSLTILFEISYLLIHLPAHKIQISNLLFLIEIVTIQVEVGE